MPQETPYTPFTREGPDHVDNSDSSDINSHSTKYVNKTITYASDMKFQSSHSDTKKSLLKPPKKGNPSYKKLIVIMIGFLSLLYVVVIVKHALSQCPASIELDDTVTTRVALANNSHPPYVPIPHIIHQSWKTQILPYKFQAWRDTWINHHKEWEYILWTDSDNIKICKDHFPWMLERFQAFPKNINRADTARYMYMYLHGGFYADLDMECLKPHTVIAQRGGLVAPLMSRDYSFEHNIPNAWMGSAPRHPFWIFLLNKIKDRPLDNEIESATGPVVMYHALREFEKDYLDETMPPITYMSPETILPYDWHNTANLIEICSAQRDTLDPEKCKKAVDPDLKAFAITYWSHTWGDGDGKISTPFR